ncbi:MAG: T9SS type A sorting domain-containing protein [Chitinophagales bacterium]
MKLFRFLYNVCNVGIAVCLLISIGFAQHTNFNNTFDYKNINKQTFVPSSGFSDVQNHQFTILKHSYDIQHINSSNSDTAFVWRGLKGIKTFYTKDSLVLFFVRPNDTITRPCILLTHGNAAKYKSNWSEIMNFYTIDLAMRGFCVAYYENSASFESSNKFITNQTRKSFYNGFQAAVAADIFLVENATTLKIDTTKLFSGGYSFGAFCSLSLATADVGINFIDTLFADQGNFSAKSIYNTSFRKNIKRSFVFGGGLPKDDTISINNSQMGNFLDNNDDQHSLLFLHGRNDNFVGFDVTPFGTNDTVASLFYVEGPRAIHNNINQNNLGTSITTFVNCKGEHPFVSTVCGSQHNCIQQYQWPYLSEPDDSIIPNSSYFSDSITDTLLHYFNYMLTQIDDASFLIADFLQPSVSNVASNFNQSNYFLQPQDTFTYQNPNGYFIFKNTDCEGNTIVVSDVHQHPTLNKKVNVYPNPTNNVLFVEAKKPIHTIRIYSMLGVLLKEIKCNNLRQEMNLNQLQTGEYICVFIFNDEQIAKKITVLH